MYKTHLKIITLISALFISLFSNGQNSVSVSGRVLDSQTREPLIGASVTQKGTLNGTMTNIDGSFTLNTTINSTLVISYVGYYSREVDVISTQQIEVLLEEKDRYLDEVVVIGYGVQKKSDVTGAISSVAGKDINNVPVASPL